MRIYDPALDLRWIAVDAGGSWRTAELSEPVQWSAEVDEIMATIAETAAAVSFAGLAAIIIYMIVLYVRYRRSDSRRKKHRHEQDDHHRESDA